jgi:hypothetical protein
MLNIKSKHWQKKKWAKKEDKTFNQALLALPTYYYPRQGYLLCLDSL